MTRNFAERARLFCSSSSSLGTIGFLVASLKSGLYSSGMTGRPGGKSGPFVASWNKCFVMRSSKE